MSIAIMDEEPFVEAENAIESRELIQAREAVLELLATTLDSVLLMVIDARRSRRLDEIATACDRIGFLGQAARRLGV